MKKRFLSLISIVIIISLFLTGTVSAGGKDPGSLVMQPGTTVTFNQTIPINIVFIGYDPAAINLADLNYWLPDAYEPQVRYPAFYGLSGRDMGLHFDFTYKTIFKNAAFESQFFNYLTSIGKPGNPTAYQNAYNAQATNLLDVTGPVLYIDGPSVEAWLTKFLKPAAKSYTVVFINWYDNPRFKFHVYTKTDEPDIDTGYNFGQAYSSRKTIAWGGSKSRLWFYDLSAGPEAWSYNYIVDAYDLDGNGSEDYRMPAIWEYDAAGYRDPAALGNDLGMVARFVAIDLLFTTSPLYDPMVTAPGVGGSKVIHVNMMEDDPASLGTDWINMSAVKSRYQAFQPYVGWKTGLTDTNPIDASSQRSFRIWAELLSETDCWDAAMYFFDPYAQLFCYFDANRATYIPAYEPADYVAGFHAFNTVAANLGVHDGLLGFSDDNWIDGTQSYVFEFDTDDYRASGYGFTTTTIHEGGHHFGMSHPHDGYDWEYDVDYGPADLFFFAWSGDESNTIMHYMDLSTTFGKFDQDNMYRYEMAGYLNWSNELLGDMKLDPEYSKVTRAVAKADNYYRSAITLFNAWNYNGAVKFARMAYEELAKAAALIGVPTPAFQAMNATPNLQAPREGDPIRFPDETPDYLP
jgi:hypothetical protein